MEKGGNVPCTMNAANEVVVDAFLHNKVGFLEMSDIIEQVINKVAYIEKPNLEDYDKTNHKARSLANELVKKSQLSIY